VTFYGLSQPYGSFGTEAMEAESQVMTCGSAHEHFLFVYQSSYLSWNSFGTWAAHVGSQGLRCSRQHTTTNLLRCHT
jgi:hypothetical protein